METPPLIEDSHETLHSNTVGDSPSPSYYTRAQIGQHRSTAGKDKDLILLDLANIHVGNRGDAHG